MRLSNIAHLYAVRLKARTVLVQELLAVLGLAVGVALLFSSQVASTSLDASVAQLASGVVGKSTYQLKARGPNGFNESVLGTVRRLPGVRAAIPVLEQPVVLSSAHGSRPVDLIATDPRSVHLAGRLLRGLGTAQLPAGGVLALPAPIANELDVGPLEAVRLQVGARVTRALVGAELSTRTIGALVDSPIALAPLSFAQRVTEMRGRITRLFVQVLPGAERRVEAELASLSGPSINLVPAGFEATLFSQAATPVNQSTKTFAAICALVGFMFAYCAMLLTNGVRLVLVRELRRNGATRGGVAKALLFDAAVLTLAASIVGVGLGDLLSIAAFNSPPGFLSFGFPIGSQRVVTSESVILAIGAGGLAACAGALSPMSRLWLGTAESDERGGFRSERSRAMAMFLAGCLCLAGTTLILVLAPQSAIIGVALLVAALFFLLRPLLETIVGAAGRLRGGLASGAMTLAVVELRARASGARSAAIAATGAIAVFGTVTIQGARANLQAGLDRLARDVSQSADLWIVPPGEQDLLTTDSFRGVAVAGIANLPGVRAVGDYRAGFLEYGNRRVWVLAPPPGAFSPLPPSQLVEGDLRTANRRLREGGWAAVSRTLAQAHHLRVGQFFQLPAPVPGRLRVAALTTNLGWPPGAIIVNYSDYVHAWGSTNVSGYNVWLAPHARAGAVSAEIRRGFAGAGSGLSVQTARQHEQSLRAATHGGLDRLTQIALLMLVSGALATATVMSILIWQRRRRFARMKVQGFDTGTLWRALIWESALLVGAGCSIGACLGVYGQLLLGHALIVVTGFPVVPSANAWLAVVSLVLVTAVAGACVALPGYRAAAVAPYPWTDG